MRQDAVFIFLSIIVAFLLAQTNALEQFILGVQGLRFFGSFIAGIFFTSVFTLAPSTVVLGEIARSESLFLVALFGAIGAVIGDMVLFLFIRDHLSKSISSFFTKLKIKHFHSFLRTRMGKRLATLLGAVIIASPLPDELGLTLMGLSKTQAVVVAPLSFLMNFLGILAVGFIARSL
ncbi:MAG: hypothetical protein AAB587_01500 [Patescibacteria group bacterium]